MKTPSLLFLLLLPLVLPAQTNSWTSLNSPTSRDLTFLEFVDDLTGVTAPSGNPAEVWYTSDGGITWLDRRVGNSDFNLFELRMVSPTVMVAAGWESGTGDPKIYYTDQAGQSWTDITPSVPVGDIGSVVITDAQTIYINDHQNGNILKTENAGQSWGGVHNLNLFQAQDGHGSGDRIWFAGMYNIPQTFFSYGMVVWSSDGGMTWDSAQVRPFSIVYNIQYFDQQNGLARTIDSLFRTSDGGATWTSFSVPFSGVFYRDVDFRSQDTGLVAGATDIYYTDGTTWTIEHSIPGASLLKLTWAGNTAYAAGQNGLLLRRDPIVGLYSPNTQPNVRVYPNPTTDGVFVDIVHPMPYRIHNQTGQLSGSGTARPGNHRIDLTHLAPGLYWLSLFPEAGVPVRQPLVIHRPD